MLAIPASGEVPDVFKPVLTRLRLEADDLFGGSVRLEPVGYQLRPFSHVLRVGVHGGGGAQPWHCFAKVFKPLPVADGEDRMQRRVLHEFETTRRIQQALSAREGLDAVRPVACYPDLLAVVTEEVIGPTLMAHLEARAAWFPRQSALAELATTMASVGRWVKAFQTIEPGTETIAVEDLRAYIDLRLQRLVAGGSRVVTARVRGEILSHIDRLGRQLMPDDLRSVMVHSDLAPGNVIVSGSRIVVLDFAMTSRGTFLHDLTRLALQVDLLSAKPQFRRPVIGTLRAALLAGFDPELAPERPLFRLLTLLHRINHLATLTLKPAPFPASLYNRKIRALHSLWITNELRDSQPSGPGSALR